MTDEGMPTLAPQKLVFVTSLRGTPVSVHSALQAAQAYAKARLANGVGADSDWRIYELVLDRGAFL